MSLLSPALHLVLGDIEGKLDMLRVECSRCERKGRYSVRKLIEKYGRMANMMTRRDQGLPKLAPISTTGK
jgi:hypothetical protein